MSQFIDRAVLQLHRPAPLAALLKGTGTAPYPHLERLLAAVFGHHAERLDRIEDLEVVRVEPVVLLPEREVLTATWTVTQPTSGLGDVRGELRRAGSGPYAHLMASVQVTAVVELGGSPIDTMSVESIEDITSFADFESRFRFLDLARFLDTHGITTVDQLRQAGPHVLTEIRLVQPPAFDPQDPANAYDVQLDVAIVVLETLDVTAGLVAARELWNAGTSQPPGVRSPVLGPTTRPFAVAVVFPRSALGPTQPSAAAIGDLYAAAAVLPLFTNPP